jgi:hypothetical protein
VTDPTATAITCPNCGHQIDAPEADAVWHHVMAEKDRRDGIRVIASEDACEAAWPGGSYMDGHACERESGHEGRHRCSCGAQNGRGSDDA